MRKIYSILLAGLLPFALHAQEATSDALPFVQIDFNPASLAQGSSVVPTVASIPFADFTISAGGAFEQYMPEISATQYISGGAAGKYGKLGAALSFARGSGEEISSESFTPTEILVNAGVAYALLDVLSAGINVKYAKEQLLSDYSNDAVAVDIFAAGVFGKYGSFNYTAGISNVGSKVSSSATGDFSLPAAATAAIGYHYGAFDTHLGPSGHRVELNARADYFFSGSFAASIGAEYGFGDLVFARAGYHYGGESVVPSFASAGLGLHISMITLDAAYLFASDVLGGSFAVSARVKF